MNRNTLVQMRANLLSVGSPAVLEFRMKPSTLGKFRLRVRVDNEETPGEKLNDSLKIIVHPGRSFLRRVG